MSQLSDSILVTLHEFGHAAIEQDSDKNTQKADVVRVDDEYAQKITKIILDHLYTNGITHQYFLQACEDHRDHFQRVTAVGQLFYMTVFGAGNETFTHEQVAAVKGLMAKVTEMLEAIEEERDGDEMPDKYSINIIWSDDDGGFIATVPELPGLSAFGATADEAFAELKIAKEFYLQVAKR